MRFRQPFTTYYRLDDSKRKPRAPSKQIATDDAAREEARKLVASLRDRSPRKLAHALDGREVDPSHPSRARHIGRRRQGDTPHAASLVSRLISSKAVRICARFKNYWAMKTHFHNTNLHALLGKPSPRNVGEGSPELAGGTRWKKVSQSKQN